MISTIAYACIFASYTQLPASADWTMVERIGPPTYHFVDVERYRFFCLNLNNFNFYPIPPNEVTRGTYVQELDQLNLPGVVANTDRGEWGPFPICAGTGQIRAKRVTRSRERTKQVSRWSSPRSTIPIFRIRCTQ